MKNIVFYLGVCFFVSLVGMDIEIPRVQKSKIVIFTSGGGAGHTSATKALHEYLENDYTLKDANMLVDVLSNLDVLRKITTGDFCSNMLSAFGSLYEAHAPLPIGPVTIPSYDLPEYANPYNCEKLYNDLLIHNQHFLIRALSMIKPLVDTFQHPAIAQAIDTYIEREKPAMIISVIPLYNYILAESAAKRGIPFWVIPTDFDATMFVEKLAPFSGKKCFVNISLEDPIVAGICKKAGLQEAQYTYSGFPVRKQFMQRYDTNLIKKSKNIDSSKKVIMVMLGGQGAVEMPILAFKLSQIKRRQDIHFLFCIGGASVKDALQIIIDKNGMNASIIPSTPNIAPLMAISDFIITKSGGQTVAEAICMKLPLILDARHKALPWEELNRTFVLEKKIGALVYSADMMVEQVEKILDNPQVLNIWKNNLKTLPIVDPSVAIKKTVDTLFTP